VLKYIIRRNNDIDGLKLSPGDITYGFYWTDRPYTLYVWIVNQGKDRAYYFNIADRILLQPAEFIWRDLAIGILIDPDLLVHMLDEDELPADLDPQLSQLYSIHEITYPAPAPGNYAGGGRRHRETPFG